MGQALTPLEYQEPDENLRKNFEEIVLKKILYSLF